MIFGMCSHTFIILLVLHRILSLISLVLRSILPACLPLTACSTHMGLAMLTILLNSMSPCVDEIAMPLCPGRFMQRLKAVLLSISFFTLQQENPRNSHVLVWMSRHRLLWAKMKIKLMMSLGRIKTGDGNGTHSTCIQCCGLLWYVWLEERALVGHE